MNDYKSIIAKCYNNISRLERYADLKIDDFSFMINNLADVNKILKICDNNSNDLMTFICLLIVYDGGGFKFMAKNNINQLKDKLASLSCYYGFYDLTLKICDEISSNRNITTDNNSKYPTLALLKKAKAFRGLGKYSNALEAYRLLLLHASKNENELMIAYILMMMGKLSHNHLWRVGQHRQLIYCASTRLKKYLEKCSDLSLVEKAKWYLAICYDSLAKIEYEILVPNNSSEIPTRIYNKIQGYFEKAIEINSKLGIYNSELRVKFRKTYIDYFITKTKRLKLLFLKVFRDLIYNLENDQSEHRGLSVRYRQIAEMLFAAKQFDEASMYAGKAINNSLKFSDWRSYARSSLIFAQISFKQGDNKDKSQGYISNSIWALKIMSGQHPELEVDVYLSMASMLFSYRDYNRSKQALEKAMGILQKLEYRVLEDNLLFRKQQIKKTIPERIILNDTEWYDIRISLMDDYHSFSTLLKNIFRKVIEIADISSRHYIAEQQQFFLAAYMLNWQHRLNQVWGDDTRNKVLSVIKKSGISKEVGEDLNNISKLIRDWRKEIDNNFDVICQRPKFVSVKKILELLQNMDFELAHDPNLRIIYDGIKSEDFEIECYEPLILQALTNFIENSARILRENRIGGENRIWLRTKIINHSTHGISGVIEIEDNAKEFNKLLRRLKRKNERFSGLLRSEKFFQHYNAKILYRKNRNGNTVIQIILAKGQRVRIERKGH